MILAVVLPSQRFGLTIGSNQIISDVVDLLSLHYWKCLLAPSERCWEGKPEAYFQGSPETSEKQGREQVVARKYTWRGGKQT